MIVEELFAIAIMAVDLYAVGGILGALIPNQELDFYMAYDEFIPATFPELIALVALYLLLPSLVMTLLNELV
jgi:hypothetical protein